MSYNVQADQVKMYAGLDALGTEQYASLQKFADERAFIKKGLVAFTLASAKAVLPLGNGSYPSGLVYTDGSSFKSLNGGIPAFGGAIIGDVTLDTLTVGGSGANVFQVLDMGDDDVIQQGGLKKVYAIASTDLSDGVELADDKVQLSFVVRDDATNGWESITLGAGNYQFILNGVWGVGNAIVAGKFGSLLATSASIAIGSTVEQSYEELLAIFPSPYRSQTHLVVNAMTKLQADSKVLLTLVGGNGNFTDSASTQINGNATSTANIKFPLEVKLGGSNNTSGFVAGVTVRVGGLELDHTKIAISSANELTLDMSEVLNNGTLYKDTAITVDW